MCRDSLGAGLWISACVVGMAGLVLGGRMDGNRQVSDNEDDVLFDLDGTLREELAAEGEVAE